MHVPMITIYIVPIYNFNILQRYPVIFTLWHYKKYVHIFQGQDSNLVIFGHSESSVLLRDILDQLKDYQGQLSKRETFLDQSLCFYSIAYTASNKLDHIQCKLIGDNRRSSKTTHLNDASISELEQLLQGLDETMKDVLYQGRKIIHEIGGKE